MKTLFRFLGLLLIGVAIIVLMYVGQVIASVAGLVGLLLLVLSYEI